jgi:hypothetical protein
VGGPAESQRVAVAMHSIAQIDLCNGVQSLTLDEVHQEADLDRVTGEEGQLHQLPAPPCVVARKRLNQTGQRRIQKVEQRPDRNLGYRPPAGEPSAERRIGRR